MHFLSCRRVAEGVDALGALVASLGESGGLHLVGHSVGGATALAYLAALREGVFPLPPGGVRTVVTLDAAVAGLAGLWSEARSYLSGIGAPGLAGVGVWAQTQEIAVLTTTNEQDLWSHRALADLPYLGVRLGPPVSLRRHFDGTIHDLLRSNADLPRLLWR